MFSKTLKNVLPRGLLLKHNTNTIIQNRLFVPVILFTCVVSLSVCEFPTDLAEPKVIIIINHRCYEKHNKASWYKKIEPIDAVSK